MISPKEKANAVNDLNNIRSSMRETCPFFGSIAFRMLFTETEGLGRWGTDGRQVKYDPRVVNADSLEVSECLMKNELLHRVFRHWDMREDRHPFIWDVACDLAVNHILIEEPGFSEAFLLPGRAPFESYLMDLTCFEYYDLILNGEKDVGPDDGSVPLSASTAADDRLCVDIPPSTGTDSPETAHGDSEYPNASWDQNSVGIFIAATGLQTKLSGFDRIGHIQQIVYSSRLPMEQVVRQWSQDVVDSARLANVAGKCQAWANELAVEMVKIDGSLGL